MLVLFYDCCIYTANFPRISQEGYSCLRNSPVLRLFEHFHSEVVTRVVE